MCIRVPATSSNRSSVASRSSNVYQKIEIAPSSSAEVPSQTRCECTRVISAMHVRIQVAFSRHVELEQLLDREHEGELVDLEGDVVDPLRVRDALPPGLALHRLLEAGVEVADHGRDPRHVLAVEVDDEPQHAVRGGVVGAEVDREDLVERVLGRIDLEHGRDRARDPASPRRSSRCARRTGHRH